MTESDTMRSAADELVIIGLDTEYVARGETNHILSYQWYIFHGGRECSGILLVDGIRQKFRHLLQRILGDAKTEGLFDRYPRAVVMAAHFSLAEIAAMADFEQLKTQMDGIRRTFTSVTKPMVVRIRDGHGNGRKVAVTLRDTMLLTPQGAGLQELGAMHGIPKIEISHGTIERMDELLRDEPALFERYALRDAEIAARHALAMAELNGELNQCCEVPGTLGGLAIKFSLTTWKAEGIDPLEVLGQEVEIVEVFDPRTRRTRKTKETKFKVALREHHDLAVESYHGGRNEAFYFGATSPGAWIDVDLCGAYSTALAAVGMPQWGELRVTTNIDAYTPDVLGLARVAFRFPDAVRFPCLPVRALNNLIFPRSGETHATAPEIWLARRLGAEDLVVDGTPAVTRPGGFALPTVQELEAALPKLIAATAVNFSPAKDREVTFE